MLGRIGAATTGARSRRGQGEGYIVARAGVAHVHGLQKLGLLHLGLGLGASPLPVLDGDRQGVGDGGHVAAPAAFRRHGHMLTGLDQGPHRFVGAAQARRLGVLLLHHVAGALGLGAGSTAFSPDTRLARQFAGAATSVATTVAGVRHLLGRCGSLVVAVTHNDVSAHGTLREQSACDAIPPWTR